MFIWLKLSGECFACFDINIFFEIIYVVQGNCINSAGSQMLDLREGDLLILAPNTEHAVSLFNDESVVLNIMVKVSVFEDLFFRLFKQRDIMNRFFTKILYEYQINTFLLFHTDSDILIKETFLNLHNESKKNTSYNDEMKAAYLSLVFTLLLNKYEKSATIYNDSLNESDHNLAVILRYAQENYKTVTIKELSQKYHYSERHLLRIFKMYTGYSFQQALQKVRMQHASFLLTQTTDSVESIALSVGYPSVQNFRVIFKREYGMSPSEYRKSTTV